LSVQPKANVTIGFIILDPSEVAINKTFLTFTPENWNQSQSILLTGVDDYLLDGDISSSLIILVDQATLDLDYLTADYVSVYFTNLDNELDFDNDGIPKRLDNCPLYYNPDQEDLDGDGLGNPCDSDIDGDGVTNSKEITDLTDPYDNCDFLNSSITLIITTAFDCDKDGVPDDIDLDDDNDGILDSVEKQDDFDFDGKENSSDLDSDGDGCFDTIEAGFQDPDQDGILGSSPVEVDSQGRVISAIGYTTPLEFENSGQYDYLELPVSPTISIQPPTSLVLIPYQETLLTIEINDSEMFNIQWQILQSPSTDWQNIQASGSFRGVTSKNLVLVNPQDSWVDWKLRAAISSKNYRCDPFNFTQETLLVYQSLFIPNAFSPDNDGVNENWIIEGLGQFPDHQLSVYSRWETLVLREAPYKNDWNGESRASHSSSNEQNLPEGTYFYILELGNGQPPLKGFIYLKR
jgi:gliding motility-associated-like protein